MQYDKNRFKVLALPHPFILFWVLCPVFIFDELIFGQRLPKVALIDKKSDKPERGRYIPCPHCETLHDGRLWAKREGFGHWFGLVCPSCHEIIPCLWNIFSLAILAMTFPLWYFPARFFRQRWFEKEKERLAKVLERPLIQAKSIKLFLIETFYGLVFTWLVFGVWPVLNGEEWDLRAIFDMLPTCLLTGLLSGSFMHVSRNLKEKDRLAKALELPLIQAKSIKRFESIKWFFRGIFYVGGFLWLIFGVSRVLNGEEWDLRAMFDTLPFALLGGFTWGLFMHVGMNLKGRKT